ncbi:MAG: PspC domain-containing protein [Acidimicrobiales bacterium]
MKLSSFEESDVTTTTPPRAIIGTPLRPYRRGVDNAILGGVCGGLAIRLGVKERTVRVLFSLSALVSGAGLLLYMLIWLTLPRAGEEQSIANRLVGRRRKLRHILLGLIVIAAVAWFVSSLGVPNLGVFTWPLWLSLLAVFGVFKGASADERHHLEELLRSAPLIGKAASRDKRSFWLRVALGAILVYFGLRILRHFGGAWGFAAPALFGTLVLLIGVLILLAPWWLTTLGDLSGERRARMRVEERANVAAHLHDSVLQTLTLIERSAGDEAVVVRLARNQERELRSWLFDPENTDSDAPTTYASLLRALQGEIENDYGVTIELVTVGDCDADDKVVALVAAAREAAINAAQWSNAATVSIYGEVEADSLTLFVRDLGRGFDVEAVPSDRRGIALSIRQRMEHQGGSASIKSIVGAGTEVELTLPRSSDR